MSRYKLTILLNTILSKNFRMLKKKKKKKKKNDKYNL